MASNENPFGPSPKALRAIRLEAKRLQVYPDQKSTPLREALAKKFGLSPEGVIVGNGSDDIMQVLAATYLEPGDEVIVSENSFSVYELVSRLFGARPVFVPLKNFVQDLNAIGAAVTPKTKMIFMTNPHNPTGSYFASGELATFLDRLPPTVLVVIDEAYAEFAEAKDFPASIKELKAGRNVVVLRTFSKFYGLAGLRVGYGLAKEEIVRPMMKAKMPFNVSRLAQAGALAALNDKTFLKKTAQNNLKERKYLSKEFSRLGLDFKKSEANFILVDLKKPADQFAAELMKKGIIVRPLTSFGLPQAVRISIGTRRQNERLIKALT